MTMRDDLEKLIRMGYSMPTLESISDFVEFSTIFLRDHGQALLEALARYDALRCEADILCQAIRSYNFAGVGPTEDPFVESCVLAVESCLFRNSAIDTSNEVDR